MIKNGKHTFSVVICTHNRCEYLADTLESLVNQAYPSDAYEIIVVDNASTDHTRSSVEKIKSSASVSVRYIYKSEQGLSIARNAGARESKFENIAYIDDDAVANSDWLSNLAKAYEQNNEVSCVGGSSQLRWEGNRPNWLGEKLEGYLSSTTHLGTVSRILGDEEYPVGTNFSIRKTVFFQVGGFDQNLGRKGNNLLSGEEIEFCRRARADGNKIFFASDALVYHRIHEKRVKASYFLKRAFWQGISDAIVWKKTFNKSRLSIPAQIARFSYQIVKDLVSASFRIVNREPKKAFYYCFYAMEKFGWIKQLLGELFGFKSIKLQA